VAGGEPLEFGVPEGTVCESSMDEQQGRFARPARRINDSYAVDATTSLPFDYPDHFPSMASHRRNLCLYSIYQ
jgi:hypothetical protein